MNHSRRCLQPVFILLLGVALAVSPVWPAEEAADGDANDYVSITPRHEEAIEKGLAWLARNQAKDGSWGAEGSAGQYQMAMTGLSGLAFLAAGHSPGRGKYGLNVARAVEFVLRHQDRDGLITSPSDGQQMYGHGFCLMFLGEVYGMSASLELNSRLREALARAVKKTQQAQSVNGGWYYSPSRDNDEGSVTVTQVQALRSARNAGIEVSGKTLDQAISYIRNSQNPDGGIRYSVQMGQVSSVALTAAGVDVLLMAGRYTAEPTRKACEYLKRNLDALRTQGNHDFYTNFYGAQAMFQIGGGYWLRYFEKLRGRLLKSQSSDGAWRGDIGSTYCTAIGTMILSVPYAYLPIFQK